mmetsp:Transcript_4303/g.12400  ORF Transcript_4303/g.12400 Transcript_4303/m.12400 type:complete len:983 (-) Transcript_4303:227-3175(-)
MEMRQPLLDVEAAGGEPQRDEYKGAGEKGYEDGHSLSGNLRNGLSSPDLLESSDVEWSAMPNLDLFFTRVYSYYEEKGFWVAVAARVSNLVALGFTAAFSGFLLLWVDWGALNADCLRQDSCDILDVAILRHPLQHGAPLWSAARVLYLALLAVYWVWNLVHLAVDVRALAEVRHFCNQRLGLSERAVQTVSWPDVTRRIVEVQQHMKLCVKRNLTEHDIVSRIMRKDNYLIGMLNKGVLALHVPILGSRRFMLTKTLEWNLRWGLLDHMLDDRTFTLRPDFVSHPDHLARRFRHMAVANMALSPFLFVFLAIHFFLRNAEQLYHHPSSVGARRWSPLAFWRLREFNELPHFIDHRLSASHAAAEKYIGQFPNPLLSHVARLVAFIAGSFAALALGAAMVEDFLLERRLAGRTLVWWAAALGVVLAISRAFIVDDAAVAFHPELAMLEVVAHTHHLPRHWRGRAHTREVQGAFQALFPFKAILLAEEMLSVLLTPFVLYFSLPACADDIVAFVRDNTTHVDGLGDVCSLAGFDLRRHGNPRYGSPVDCPKAARSRQGKMEKSLLSFATTYPGWDPGAAAKQLLGALRAPHPPPGAANAAAAGGSQWRDGVTAYQPHYPFTKHLSESLNNTGRTQLLPPDRRSAAVGGRANGHEAVGAHMRHRRSIFASSSDVASSQWGSPSLGGLPAGGASWVAAAAAVQAAGLGIEDRIAASQIMLQSFYEEHEDAALAAAAAEDAKFREQHRHHHSHRHQQRVPPQHQQPLATSSSADGAGTGNSASLSHSPQQEPPLHSPSPHGAQQLRRVPWGRGGVGSVGSAGSGGDQSSGPSGGTSERPGGRGGADLDLSSSGASTTPHQPPPQLMEPPDLFEPPSLMEPSSVMEPPILLEQVEPPSLVEAPRLHQEQWQHSPNRDWQTPSRTVNSGMQRWGGTSPSAAAGLARSSEMAFLGSSAGHTGGARGVEAGSGSGEASGGSGGHPATLPF